MSFARQRSGRSDWARRHFAMRPEALESRQLLAQGMGATYLFPWLPTDSFVTNPITHQRELYLSTEAVNPEQSQQPRARQPGQGRHGHRPRGRPWAITVHGPGYVVVTDTTPNDGALDDDINTIQLVNTSLKSTYVTGNVFASNQPQDIAAGESTEPSNGAIVVQSAHRGLRREVNPAQRLRFDRPGDAGRRHADGHLPVRRRRRALVRWHHPAGRSVGLGHAIPDRHRRSEHATQGSAVNLRQSTSPIWFITARP